MIQTKEGCVCALPGELQCNDRNPDGGYICTRVIGHGGDHVCCRDILHKYSAWANRPRNPVQEPLSKLFDMSAEHILENQKLRHAGAELLQTVHDLQSHQKSIQFCDLEPCTRMYPLFVKQTKKEPSR